jgi:phosphohistidine phosphatase
MNTVYFVQHGLAHSSEENESRPLTEPGVQQVKTVAEFLKHHDIEVRHLRHSGKLRARQTADIFAQILGVADNQAQQGMNPNDDPAALAATIEDDEIMYIGHLPQLNGVVSLLLCGDTEQTIVQFHNAGVVCLGMGGNSASLQWYLTPDLLN